MGMAATNEEIQRGDSQERARQRAERRPQRLMAELDGVLESLEALNLKGAASVPPQIAREAQTTLAEVLGRPAELPGNPVAALDAVFDVQGRLLKERFPAFHEEDEEG